MKPVDAPGFRGYQARRSDQDDDVPVGYTQYSLSPHFGAIVGTEAVRRQGGIDGIPVLPSRVM